MAKRYLQLSKTLQKLLYEHRMSSADLARATDLPTPTIHRLVTGKSTRPYSSSLEPIAQYFSIDVEQLLGEKPLPEPEKEKLSSSTDISSNISYIPLIEWDNLNENQSENDAMKIPFFGKISESGFATYMPDTSMEPFIQRNSILIFDTQLKSRDRSYVLVKLHETQSYVFRQLLIDAEYQYLKPLNPDLSSFKMRLLNTHDRIVGTLVESRCNYVENNFGAIGESVI